RSTTQPGGWLKHQIPVRTFADWDDARPGFLEIDLVAHCGEDGGGFFLHTLCAVDIGTGWVELQPVWGKGHKRVRAALHEVRRRLPVRLCGVATDNGSEFIHRALFDYCRSSGSRSPAVGRTVRTTAPTSSRRMARSSGRSWVTTATRRAP